MTLLLMFAAGATVGCWVGCYWTRQSQQLDRTITDVLDGPR